VAAPTEVDRAITVESVRTENGHVRGRIFNRSSTPVNEVTLLIQQTYVWPNEFKPHGENPSRALVRHLTGPIAPGQALEFDETIPEAAASGGTFETRVMILGYRYQEVREPEGPQEVPAMDPTGSALPLSDFVAGC
jgi:hypothetical protein